MVALIIVFGSFVPVVGATEVDFPRSVSLMGTAVWHWSCGSKSGEFLYGTIPNLSGDGTSLKISTTFDSFAQIVGGFDDFVLTISSPALAALPAFDRPTVYIGGNRVGSGVVEGSNITYHSERDDLHSTNVEIEFRGKLPNGYIQILDFRLLPSNKIISNVDFYSGYTASGIHVTFPYTYSQYYDLTLSCHLVAASYMTVEILGDVLSFSASAGGNYPLPVTKLSANSDIPVPDGYRPGHVFLVDIRSAPSEYIAFNVRCASTPFIVGQPLFYPDSAIDDDRFFLAVWFERIWDTLKDLVTGGDNVDVDKEVGPAIDNQQQVDNFQDQGFNEISSGSSQVSSNIIGTVTRLGPTLSLCSQVLTGAFDSLGDFHMVYTLPIFIGIFCYACGRVVSTIRSEANVERGRRDRASRKKDTSSKKG